MSLSRYSRCLGGVLLLLVAVMAAVFQSLGWVINTTASVPVGLYRRVDDPIEKSSVVLFCPPVEPFFIRAQERGYIGHGLCKGGFEPLLKQVVAVQGDGVLIADAGILVNHFLVPSSRLKISDSKGRPLGKSLLRPGVLATGELLLLGINSPDSFDARYFGLVDQRLVISVVEPVMLW